MGKWKDGRDRKGAELMRERSRGVVEREMKNAGLYMPSSGQ